MNDNQGRYNLIVYNMTNFFNRELLMYSIGDIKFKKPISLKRVGYTTAFFIIWTIPLILIFGFVINVFFLAIAILPPLFIGNFAARPVWGGRSLIDFLKVSFNFLTEPKGWTDLKPNNGLGKDIYYVEDEIWVSRRRELQLLAQMKEKHEHEKHEKLSKKGE